MTEYNYAARGARPKSRSLQKKKQQQPREKCPWEGICPITPNGKSFEEISVLMENLYFSENLQLWSAVLQTVYFTLLINFLTCANSHM